MARRAHRNHLRLEPSRLHSFVERTGSEHRQAAALLGADDPLVRVLDRLDVVSAQSRSAALPLVLGAAGLAAGASWARPLLAVAGLVQLALLLGIVLLVLLRNERARDLIGDGCERVPLGAICRERNRLLSRRRRLRLAGSIEHLLQTAERWSRTPRPRQPAAFRPLFDVPKVRRSALELRQVALMLRSDPVGARGVALVERLLTCPGSPLYEGDFAAPTEEDALEHELRLIKAALSVCGDGKSTLDQGSKL
jgi:hypothetical protein